MNFVFINILFLTLSRQAIGQSTYECHDVDECALQSMSDTATSGSNIECYGYFSCTQAAKIESTAAAYIECFGSYSCYQSTLIQHKVTGTSYSRSIFCFGLLACAQVELIYNELGLLLCDGELSCAESTAVLDRSSMRCDGTRACYQANLTVADNMWLDGHLAAQDAILRTNDTSVNFYFRGDDAGNGAEIICANNGTCNIFCYSTGCNNLTLSCQDGSGSCITNTYNVYCTEICPNGYINGNNNTIDESLSILINNIPNLRDKQFSTYNNSYESCTTAKNCHDYQDSNCDYDGFLVFQGNLFCCSAYQACKASSITTIIETDKDNVILNDSDTYVYETGFRADGYYSADVDDYISATIKAKNGGNMYFTGRDANFDWSSTYVTKIENNGIWDIIASGSNSLRNKIIANARNLYCSGTYSCYRANISSIDGMIYAGGYWSIHSATISNVSGSVYCPAYQSCFETQMSDIQENIVGVGYWVLYNSQITNVNGTLAAYGERSLYLSQMTSVENVELPCLCVSCVDCFLSTSLGSLLFSFVVFCLKLCIDCC